MSPIADMENQSINQFLSVEHFSCYNQHMIKTEQINKLKNTFKAKAKWHLWRKNLQITLNTPFPS